jgi:MFS family permease
MRERSRRTVVVVGGLLGLVAVVAAASAGHAPGRGESRPSADVPTVLADYVASIALVVMTLGALVVLAVVISGHSYEARQRRGNRGGLGSLVTGIAFFAAALLIITHAPWADRLHWDQGGPAKPAQVTARKATPPTTTTERFQPKFRWVPVFVVGGLILGIGAAMAVSAVRRKRELLRDAPVALLLSEVLTETIDDLRREADPRKAVIKAYARMERTLAARGLPRMESEAPFEYLSRVLGSVQASAHSVRRLTQLFQRARFSTHEIDATMKEDAIEALSGLRAELEVAS